MHVPWKLTVLTFFVFISGIPDLSAQDRGRLPDGRAFRTDAEGTQLVDYIAELELSVEALNRRVQGLEGEVQTRQRQVELLQQGLSPVNEVVERDLTSNQVKPQIPQPRADSAVGEKEVLRLKEEAEIAQKQLQDNMREWQRERGIRSSELTSLRGRVSELETMLTSQTSERAGVQASAVEQLERAHAEKDRVSAELDSANADLAAERESHNSEMRSLMSQVDSLRSELGSKEQENRLLQTSLKEHQSQIKELSSQIDSLQGAARMRVASAPAAISQVEPASQKEVSVAPVIPVQDRASLAPQRGASTKSRAVDAVRSAVFTELNKVQALVSSRDKLLGQFESRARSVKFKPTRAASSNNMTIPAIRAQAAQATSVYELSVLRGDINSIRGRMQDDILLIKRMTGAG